MTSRLLHPLISRGLHRWLPSYLRDHRRHRPLPLDQPVHLVLCIADHFEPDSGDAPPSVRDRRVQQWVEHYPRLFSRFRDADNRPPQHSFFYPLEVYERPHVHALAGLCHEGFGEVEVHLHHDHDTSDNLRRRLSDFKHLLADRHNLLSRDRRTREIRYGFIHGNWALDNSRPDGRWCGVNDELTVLRETGCYADFTYPSAPSPTQPRLINRIYHATDDPHRPCSHHAGVEVATAPAPPDSLLLVPGPLMLNWRSRRRGLLPRVENACIQGTQPATIDRLDLWLRARVRVPSRPDWFFVKLHTHGAPEHNQRVLLGPPMQAFHEALAERAAADPNFHFHYVTAREMYNLVRAAEDGYDGDVADARDYLLVPNRTFSARPEPRVILPVP